MKFYVKTQYFGTTQVGLNSPVIVPNLTVSSEICILNFGLDYLFSVFFGEKNLNCPSFEVDNFIFEPNCIKPLLEEFEQTVVAAVVAVVVAGAESVSETFCHCPFFKALPLYNALNELLTDSKMKLQIV